MHANAGVGLHDISQVISNAHLVSKAGAVISITCVISHGAAFTT